MTKAFGVWLLDHQFDDEHLERVQLFWDASLACDYLPAHQYTSASQVAWILRRGVSDPDWIEEQVLRAWDLFAHESADF